MTTPRYSEEIGGPRHSVRLGLLIACRVADKYRRRLPTVQELMDDFGKAATDAATAAAAARSVADGTASGLSATNATVVQHGQQITAQGTQINQVQAGLGEKANSSALIQLDAKVSNSGGGGNLLVNSTFAPNWNRAGWGWVSNGSQWGELGNPTGDDNWRPPNIWGIGSQTGQTVPQGAASWWQNDTPVGVVGGKTYCMSAWVNCHRCDIGLELIWLTASGGHISTTYASFVRATGANPNGGLQGIPRAFAIGVAPGNAAVALFRVVVLGRGENNPYFWLFQPMLCEVAPGATSPPPYSVGGKEDHASINLMTDVNGNVSGMQVKNNGTSSEINLLASVLNVLSPGAVDGLELRDGYLRVWRGNVQRIVGNGFGPDGLMDYFGPNVGAGNASKGIATMWMDVNGNAYWGGALAAGVRRNANQSTSIQTVGNNVQVGPFDTNGGNKNVVVSFQRNISRTKWAGGNTGFVAGGGSNYAVIQVFRQIEGQGEGLWVQFTVGGDVNIFNQLDGSDSAESYWSGSYTLNDQSDGTARRTYRAVVADYGERTVTHQSGSFDTQNVTQSLSLVSIEQ